MSRFNAVPKRKKREPRFYSVGEVAAILGLSPMTIYRAIADGEFPALKIRGRVIVPANAVEQMIEAATADGTLVDAADWVRDESAT